MEPLDALSPLDGRYSKYVQQLSSIFSERGLIGRRVEVEGEYLIALSENLPSKIRRISEEEKGTIRRLYSAHHEFPIVKEIETLGRGEIRATNHDLKAVEYFIKEKLKETSLKDSLEWIHFGLTSEDVNNIAHGLMLRDSIEDIISPKLYEITDKINTFARTNSNVPMLARTHGQPASPTTFGKEFRNFSSRLERQLEKIVNQAICVKLNGATGNYNAHYISFPDFNWSKFTQDFIEGFNRGQNIKLKSNLLTTQIEPGDSYCELFNGLSLVNTILIGFNQDIWRYVSDGWLRQKPKEGDIGSSTMPHKINPIDFENSEGNLGIANALFSHFSSKIPISRLQRDLSDSTVKRNFGSALGYCKIGYDSLIKGLGKIEIDKDTVIAELNSHPEIISEAIQTILRREGFDKSYEQLKDFTRGKKVTLNDLHSFCNALDIPDEVKSELTKITPENYTGLAKHLTENF